MAVYKVNNDGERLPIDTVAMQEEQRKRDRLTIVGVLRRKRELDREVEKRKRGLKIALITGAVVMALYILFAVCSCQVKSRPLVQSKNLPPIHS